MPIIEPKETIIVDSYNDFCNRYEIKSENIVGDDGCDEELIIRDLNKLYGDNNWIINFIENNSDGYFLIQSIT